MNVADGPVWFLRMMRKVAPSLFYRGIFEYRVVKNQAGRLDIEPTDPDEELSEEAKVEVWAGIAGYQVEAVEGTIVLLAFVKGDTAKPRVIGFCPLSYTKARTSQIDANSILLGTDHHESVVRNADEIVSIVAVPGGGLTFTLKGGGVWQLLQTAGATPVTSSIVPVTNPSQAGKLYAWSDSKVKAQ